MTGPGKGASIEKQMEYVRAHPIRFVKVCAATIAEHGKIWIEHLGCLGWLDTPLNPLAMQIPHGRGWFDNEHWQKPGRYIF